MRTATALATSAAAAIALAPAAHAQQSVQINLTGLRIQNGLNQTKSSAPNTISPAFRYRTVVTGMVHGTSGILAAQFPNPTSLATVMETLAPGSSAALTTDFDNCSGLHPIVSPPITQSGSQVIVITVTYGLTLSTQIDASGVASFSLTNVVLSPSALVGSLLFDSGTATITRQYVCYGNCDGSTSAPVLNVQDFNCFLTQFASGDARANCDCSTTTPALNVQDFGCFLTRFAAGCPPQ